MAIRIKKAVGKWDGKSVNDEADVKTVQQLLNQAAKKLKNKKYAPNAVNGKISKKRSSTVEAIIEFQKRFSKKPDGRIDPGGRTWRKLANPNLGGGPFFPFAKLPKFSWTTGMRQYKWWRSNRTRLHAGCDIYFPVGTNIHAVSEGVVVANPRLFYDGAWQLNIYHPSLKKTIRYGETKKGSTKLKKGDTVEAGEIIAQVGKMKKIKLTMLHLELYKGKVSPRLVTGNSSAKGKKNGKWYPYNRLKTLRNPTAYLNLWKKNLPKSY